MVPAGPDVLRSHKQTMTTSRVLNVTVPSEKHFSPVSRFSLRQIAAGRPNPAERVWLLLSPANRTYSGDGR